jgi:hypothetical protein
MEDCCNVKSEETVNTQNVHRKETRMKSPSSTGLVTTAFMWNACMLTTESVDDCTLLLTYFMLDREDLVQSCSRKVACYPLCLEGLFFN